jgi:hypothetical protein
MAEVIGIVVLDEIALPWAITRRRVVIFRRRFCTMYRGGKVCTVTYSWKFRALTAITVQREGWIETLAVSPTTADGKTCKG